MQLQPQPWKRGEAGDRDVTNLGGATNATGHGSCVYPQPLPPQQGQDVSLWLFRPWLWGQAGDGAQGGVGGDVAEQSQISLLLGLFSISLDQKVPKLRNSVEALPGVFRLVIESPC